MLETKENGSIRWKVICNVTSAIKRDQKSGSLIGASELVSLSKEKKSLGTVVEDLPIQS